MSLWCYKPYMFREWILTDGTLLEMEVDERLNYRLRYGDLVEYSNGIRKLKGKSTKYIFRSVEQLRYDFERDVEVAGGTLR